MIRIVGGLLAGMFFVALPISTGAATDASGPPCLVGTKQDKSFSLGQVGIEGIKSGLKSESRAFASRNDKCSDEKVSIDKGLTTTITICATRRCVKGDSQYGCKKGQIAPKLAFGSPGSGFITINKCHSNNAIASALIKTIDTQDPAPLLELANTQPPFEGVSLVQNIGADALAKSLTNFGVSKDQAQSLVQNNPAAANKLIEAFQSQDVDAIQKAAGDARISLNPATINKIVSLTPEQVRQDTAPLTQTSQVGNQETFRNSNTGNNNGPSPYSGHGSPFANVSPVPISAPPLPSAPSVPAPLPSAGAVPISVSANPPVSTQLLTQPSLNSSSIVDQLQQALRGKPATPAMTQNPVATILAQPQKVARGNSIVVSWSSVGMNAGNPCFIKMGSTVLAQKNEGSKVIPTGSATARGTIVFTLTCTAQNGQAVSKSASVTIN